MADRNVLTLFVLKQRRQFGREVELQRNRVGGFGSDRFYSELKKVHVGGGRFKEVRKSTFPKQKRF
jgi:hypothetical protein